MATRNELFLTAVDVLQSGRSLDVAGEHGSGRTHFLARTSDYFTALGWQSLDIRGLAAFAKTPLVALDVAGFADTADGRPAGIAGTIARLAASVVPQRTIIVVDDGDALDEYSWGVLRAVQAQSGVPILSSRLIHHRRSDRLLPTGAFTTTYAMRLPAMGYAELEVALGTLVGVRIEPATLSRVFAKSGGNVGLAAAVVDAAIRAGTLSVEEGTARAVGSLWTPALEVMAEAILQPLPRRTVDTLEMLALLGPTGIPTAVAAVGAAAVSDLEERALLTVVDVGGRRIASITPPLLVEHFRHGGRSGRRTELISRLDQTLAESPPDAEDAAVAPRDAAVLVRLVHEQTRLRTLRARERWQAAPTLASATALLSALEVDGAHDPDEIETLLSAAQGLGGTERERAHWHVARLTGRVARDDAAAIIDELRALADTMPREGGLLRGRAVELETTFLTVAETDPLAGVDTSAISDPAHAAILRARAFWSLARGRADESEAVLARRSDLDAEPDALADALAIVGHLASERFDLATRLAEAGLASAQRRLDASLIRTYAFLAALTASLDRRPDDADRILAESAFLGLAAPLPSLSFVGLKTMAAEMAARRGQRALMEQLLAEIDAAGFSDGPLVGQTSGMPYARMAFVEGGSSAAAEACLDAGDALWERGALFSAACCYLEGVLYTPTEAVWARVSERVQAVPMAGVARRAAVAEALVARDADALEEHIARLEKEGRPREALYVVDLALTAVGDERSASLRALRDRLQVGGIVVAPAPRIVLTRREREIAELVASGLGNAVIAEALVVSVRTVESHINRLLRKAGLRSRHEVKDFLIAQDALG